MASCSKNTSFDENSDGTSDTDEDYSDETSNSCSDEYEPAWIDKIGTKGHLFYIEPFVNLGDDSSNAPEQHDQSSDYKNSSSAEVKPSTTNKLKKWMEHRKKKIKRKFLRKSSKEKLADSSEHSVPKVLSEDSPRCDIKEIYLDIKLSQHNFGRRTPLSENLFGLVVSSGTTEPSSDKVIVSEVTPEGEACKEGTIKIGDWIKSVDDNDVTISNFESVLSNIQPPKKVKLIIQRNIAQDSLSELSGENYLCDLHSLCQWFEGTGSMDKIMQKYGAMPYAIYYLSLGQESESKEHEDVIYSFPHQNGQLFKQRGTFVTLSHMISDIATPPVLSCSVIIDKEVVHVGYSVEGRQVMVLCIPNSWANMAEVQHYVHGVTKFLKLQFSSLSSTFGDAENKSYLDQFFTLFFHYLFSSKSNENHVADSHLLNLLPSVHWLPLPSDLKIVVDDLLSQFESADFGDLSDGYQDMQRIYNIRGACLFYKGYLLGSHLNKDDLLDVHLFVKYHRLLALTKSQPVAQAVVWKEIYLSRKECANQFVDPDYVEADGRYFLLIVALRYSIMATLLEAGGCSLSASGFPSPEPFYVEQVENTLLSFEEAGIFPTVNKVIGYQDPLLAAPEKFLKAEKSNWELLSSIVNFNISFQSPNTTRLLSRRSQSYSNLSSEVSKKALEMSSKKSFAVELERQQLLTNMGPADGESDAEANPTGDDTSQKHHRSCSISNSSNTGSHDSDESFMFQRSSKRIYNSSYDLRSSLSSQDQNEYTGKDSPSWLVSGCENTLFYYLHMDPVEGVFLAPTEDAQKVLCSPLGAKVLESFFSCCLDMRTTFERSLRNRELSMRTITPKFGINPFLQAVHEQGALFQCSTTENSNQKKIPQVLDFWVVGRLFFAPEPREVYVCYQDSAEQDIVELAFRLGFGLSL